MAGVFKAYDVRGVYPDGINEDIAYKIGRAFVQRFKLKTVVIGKDPGTEVDLTVSAKYRNFASNDDWLGAIEAAGEKAWEFKKMLQEGKASDAIEHSRAFAQSYAGKGTADELETALEEAAESGELRKKLDEANNADEAQGMINDFAQTRLGLDCVGFAWKMIEATGQFENFTPAFGAAGDENLADTQSLKEGWIACRGMMASATDITDQPSSWRTMDVILDPTHIIVIYDIGEVVDEDNSEVTHYHAECMESSAGGGVRKSDYLFNSLDERWYEYATGEEGREYVNASTARVMRLENNGAVQAIIERQETVAAKAGEGA